ncbi:hypothetical protein AMATHDRAFT_58087 [Amanita thiersii Skay4041]|uniref:Uncharacterized protein n=1 Tax=Amanita thiersii Skay4041 TaxID=703135 RepID=A0A2A9NW14_9AGAR|nr:hypothetical protein AMATHDRAFT_58087 [Amanita thiersii Skay4041]
MDIDWCLSCSRHTDGTGPYCSDECKYWAGPPYASFPYPSGPSSQHSFSTDPDIIYHRMGPISKTLWPGHSSTSIRAWASMIPTGPPSEEAKLPHIFLSSSCSSSSLYGTPRLLRRPQPASPTVYMSSLTPAPSAPSKQSLTPEQQINIVSQKNLENLDNLDRLSAFSVVTESLVSTPLSARASPISKQTSKARDCHLVKISSQDRSSEKFSVHKRTFYLDCFNPHYFPTQ